MFIQSSAGDYYRDLSNTVHYPEDIEEELRHLVDVDFTLNFR